MTVNNKELASLIVSFLQKSVKDNVIGEDYVESMDVAIDCIADAFGIDASESDKLVKKSFNGKTLSELVGTKPAVEDSRSVPVNISAEETAVKEKAEALKLEGNKLMAQRDFEGAIEKYSAAIDVLPTNAVYLSNRAAAYSSSGKHNLAIKDAQKAIELDPTYPRAYSRLGLANYALGDAKASLEAYKKGLEIEGDNASPGMTKGYETAKKRVEDEEVNSTETTRSAPEAGAAGAGGMPDLSNLASSLGGGAGGMPDLGGLMNNPSIMQAAQQMMQDPNAMANLMNNPMLQQMAQSFGMGGAGGAAGAGGAGGAGSAPAEGARGQGEQPNISELLNNPMLQNMANSFMNNRNNGGGSNGS